MYLCIGVSVYLYACINACLSVCVWYAEWRGAGECYLFVKEVERANFPNRMWEKVRLSRNYGLACRQIHQQLVYWPMYVCSTVTHYFLLLPFFTHRFRLSPFVFRLLPFAFRLSPVSL